MKSLKKYTQLFNIKNNIINTTKQSDNNKPLTISTLKKTEKINYYVSLVNNLSKKQSICISDNQIRQNLHLPEKTRTSWYNLFNIPHDDRHNAEFAFHSKFVFDSMFETLNAKGISFKNVMHLSTRLELQGRFNKIFEGDHVEAIQVIDSFSHFDKNRAVLIFKTTILNSHGEMVCNQFEDILIKNLSEIDLNKIMELKKTYKYKDAFTKKTTKKINDDFDKKFSVFLGKNHGQLYGNVSGDINPLHTNYLFSKMFGFKQPIIQGAFWGNYVYCLLTSNYSLKSFYINNVRPSELNQDFEIKIKDNDFEISDSNHKVVCQGGFTQF